MALFRCLRLLCVLLPILSCGERAGHEVLLVPAVEDTLGKQAALRANELYRAEERDSAVVIANELLLQGGSQARIAAWIIKGRSYQDAAQYPEALEAYGMALDLARGIGYEAGESRALNQLGLVHLMRGDHEAALRNGLENLRLKERKKDTAGVARAHHNLANMYYEQGDLSAATEAVHNSLLVKEQLGDSMGINNGLMLLCMLAIDAGEPEEAVAHMERSKGIMERNFPNMDPAPTLVNLGLAHDAAGRPEEAMRQFRKALQALEEDPNDAYRAVLMANMGQLLMDAGSHSEAGPYLQESLSLARSTGSQLEERAALGALLAYHKATGREREALEMAEALMEVNDSLLNEEKVRTMNELRVRYDSDRAAAENLRLQQLQELAEARNDRQRLLLLAIAVSVALLLVVAVVLFRNWRRRLASRIKDLEHQALRAQMDPHFLFNALSSIPGVYYESGPERATDHVGHLGQLLRLVLASSTEEWVPIRSEVDLITHYFKVMEVRHADRFTWAVRVDVDVDVERIGMPPMLLQPLVENALVHGVLQRSEGGRVEVHLSSAVNGLHCRISDNGPGMNALPALAAKGRPSGLRITDERIRLVNGRRGKGLSLEDLHTTKSSSGAVLCFTIRTEDLWT